MPFLCVSGLFLNAPKGPHPFLSLITSVLLFHSFLQQPLHMMSMLCAITSLMNIPQNSLSFVSLSSKWLSLLHNESVNDFTQLCILLLHPGNNQQLDHLDLN